MQKEFELNSGKHILTFYTGWDRHPELVKQTSAIKAPDSKIKNLRLEYESKDYNKLLFTEIGIETISRCNGRCSFCPVSVQNEKRPYVKMSDETWKRLIDQLHESGFRGTIYPYINNEIFLDKKIFDRLEYIRSVFGENVKINIESNGRLLVERNNAGIKKVEKIAKYVDQMIINDYADSLENYKKFNPRIRHLIKNLNQINLERNFDLKIVHRLENQLLNNRFGMVEGLETQTVPESELFCDFPFFQTNVNPSGDVFICCRDAYYQEVIGNIYQNSIDEIWFGKRYKEIRDSFVGNQRICDVCKKCTSSGTLTL